MTQYDEDAEAVECAVDGYERGNEFEGRSVDVCIGIIGRRAEAAERIVEAMRSEFNIVNRVHNILHAHNRPDQPLTNESRIEMRGLLGGVVNRIVAAFTAYDKIVEGNNK